MILTIAVAAPIEKFINKVIPSSLRYVLVPTLTLMVVAPLELIVLAPIWRLLLFGCIMQPDLSDVQFWQLFTR